MNETVNKLLFPKDSFISEMHLRQYELKYRARGLFTRNRETKKKEKIQDIFIKTYFLKLAFFMNCLMVF